MRGGGGGVTKSAETADRKTVDDPKDYYEILQISPNAEPETIHRVYRLLAQRYHPDAGEGASETKFRSVVEAYQVLSDPQERARYDVVHTNRRQDRWRLVSNSAYAASDFETEQLLRLIILELLYTKRRSEPEQPGVSLLDLEAMTGRAREHLGFTVWFLTQKKLITRSDGAVLTITVDGVEYAEKYLQEANQHRRLSAGVV